MAILSGFLLVVFIITAVLLVIIVLMQDEQGEGLGGIFGGGGAAPVGNRSGNILTRATSIIATIFLVSLFGYAWINRTPEESNVEAAARALEAQEEGVLEWWRVDDGDLEAPALDDEDLTEPEATIEAPQDDAETDGTESDTE
ncbi:MAG: preprotein translocase subunit SecG [Spirochaetota bacterium]